MNEIQAMPPYVPVRLIGLILNYHDYNKKGLRHFISTFNFYILILKAYRNPVEETGNVLLYY